MTTLLIKLAAAASIGTVGVSLWAATSGVSLAVPAPRISADIPAQPTAAQPTSAAQTSAGQAAQEATIEGDYVEARTAAVFAGACHYNGEYVTTGRDALLAWHFTAGSVGRVSVAGLSAVAAVTSQQNLSDPSPTRKTEIVVSQEATDEQLGAIATLLSQKCGKSLGTIVHVRRTPIAFGRSDDGFNVSATGFGSLKVKYLPDDSCCKQPGDVWYEPLSATSKRKVGFTESATYTGNLTAQWYRSDENSAFYGQINF